MPVTVVTYDTLEEAARAASDREARFFGGGTLLMRAVNYAEGGFTRIVRARDPALRRVDSQSDAVIIGAGVTMAEIAEHPNTGFLAPAARAVGGPAVRNMATVGGNLFAGHPYGDFTAALIALGAKVRTVGQGSREMPVEELVAARDRTPRVVVAAVVVPRPAAGTFRFRKVTRVHPKGVSLLSIAALLPVRAGRVSGARIAYGAMGPTPVRASAAERALEGRTLDAAGISAALDAATEGINPPTDAIASEWYRREVAPVHLRRLLLET